MAVLLFLFTAACAGRSPETARPQPNDVAKHPASAGTPVAKNARPQKPGTPPVAAPRVAAVPSRAAEPTLDLDALTERLKATKAIGVFTKISLKNQVDDLLKKFRDFYQGKTRFTMTELRGSYNLLMMKVLSLLQDSDRTLASAIVRSREAIWGLLADPKKFAALHI